MQIIIGRENVPSPRLQIEADGIKKYYGSNGSVPKSVSRKHCKLTVGPSEMAIESISADNVIYINNREYFSKKLKPGDVVELGPDKYRLDFETIASVLLKSGTSLPGKTDVIKPEYSLVHLEKVWDDYDQMKLEFQIKERRFNALSSGVGLLTTGGVACGFIPSLGSLRVVIIILALSLMIICFVIRINNSKEYVLKQRELEKDFHRKYVCPNPQCRHFLGNQPYEDVSRNIVCPWCKAKYKA